MGIRYPGGRCYKRPTQTGRSPTNNNVSYSNRGMTLEEDLNITNEYYLEQNRAVIHKKPTPVQIVHVDYPKRSAAVITEAYFKQASTTDYNGVYRGKYIDFEAKETRNKTSFPLRNFHDHQIEHMRQVKAQHGICFVILRFTLTDEMYLMDADHLFYFYDNQSHSRKSIKKTDIEKFGHALTLGYHPRIDYLQVIDTVYFQD